MSESKADADDAFSSVSNDEKYCCDGSDPDEVFITGIAGRFPWSDNVGELKEKLYNKANFFLPTEKRWPAGTLGFPSSDAAHLNDLNKFDADFFNIPYVSASNIEPMQRVALEVAYEIIADSGYNPHDFRQKDVGVYCAVTQTDLRELLLRNYDIVPFDFSGFLNALTANRVSYCLDLKGPSLVIDAAFSSSSAALDRAIIDLKDGRIEAAVVIGAEICVNPEITLGYTVSGICSLDNACYPFDSRACGGLRSDTIAGVFIQKASKARRCYAKIVNQSCYTAGFMSKGIYTPSKLALKELYLDVLNGGGIKPADIAYVEAQGFCTLTGDAIEIDSLTEVYCNERPKPLLVGTIKSNLGNSEASSTICSIMKSIFALETGLIAPNLNYEKPNPDCAALIDGRIKIVTETTELQSPYVAVSTLGIAGLNSHIILKKNALEPVPQKKKTNPALLLYSSMTEEGVKHVIDHVKSTPLPKEMIPLLNNLAYTPVSSKPYRGYALLCDEPVAEVELCLETKREIWYVVTGMGCQWPGMGTSLMEIDVFANSIRRSAKVLQPFDIDLLDLMKPNTKKLLETRRITRAFVSICAIQVALVDVLKALGIEPDGIIGHSTGELVCAYADGCCTAEETVLSAYFRGKAIETSNLPSGAMAAVGMTWQEAKETCPENVYPACHNAEDSITISGETAQLKAFVGKLEKEGRFARVVDAYGYAFHCPEIMPAAPVLKRELEKVLINPKPRSKRWLSTSFAPEEWNKPEANIADPAYFVHNLMSTVHFADALAYIPTNAITIEIGPHFLLQSILKRVIGNNASYIGMMKRNENNVNFMLATIGKLYKLGLNPKISALYPPLMYPVPRGTPPISNLLKWNHSASWPVPKYVKYGHDTKNKINLSENERYLRDYGVCGRIVYPAMGYIVLAWQSLAKTKDKRIAEMPVEIEDFRVHKTTILSFTELTTFTIRISNAKGKFEILEDKHLVASGCISMSDSAIHPPPPTYCTLSSTEIISGEELYRELRIRGYEYGSSFQAVVEADIAGTQGLIKWTNEWISYLQAHFLFSEFLHDQNLNLPVGALSIKINPIKVLEGFKESTDRGLKGLPVTYEKYMERCCSPGIEIRKIKLEPAVFPPALYNPPIYEVCEFVPYMHTCAIPDAMKLKYKEYINVCCKIASKLAFSVDKNLAIKLENCMSSDIPQETVEKYVKKQRQDYVLLNILNELSSAAFENKSHIFEQHMKNILCSDVSYKTLFMEQPLRSVLEIVAENTNRRLNAVELYNGRFSMVSTINNILKKYYNCKLNCTLLCSESDRANIGDNLNENDIQINNLAPTGKQPIEDQDLIISYFFFGNANGFLTEMQRACSLSGKESYILLYHRVFVSPAEAFLSYLYGKALETVSEQEVEAILQTERLTIIAKKSDSLGSTLYLLRRRAADLTPTSDIVVRIQDGNYNEWLDQLKLSMVSANGRVWLVGDESPTNGIVGLVKCLSQESGGHKIRCVYVIKDKTLAKIPPFDIKSAFYAEVSERDVLMNIYRNGLWGSFSNFEISSGPLEKLVEHSFLNCRNSGDLTSFRWTEAPVDYELEKDKKRNIAYIYYSALNIADMMLASGSVSVASTRDTSGNIDLCGLGVEFSGVTVEGRRIMGLTPSRAIGTSIELARSVVFDVPTDWSLEEAATVPLVYCTCYYALLAEGHLLEGDQVFIHSENDSIQIASIRIALAKKCQVYVTAYTNDNKQCLAQQFPDVKLIEMFSDDTPFEDVILNETKGKGVDVLLNSRKDPEQVLTCVRCVAENGRLLNVAKYDLSLNNHLGMSFFAKNTTFSGVFLDQLLRPDQLFSDSLQEVVKLFNEGIKSGVVKPFERTVFQRDDVGNALHYMETRKHAGKVVLKIRDDEELKTGNMPRCLKLKADPAVYFYKQKTYIIIGGLGSLGIELTKWIIRKGAKNVVITARNGATTPYHRLCLLRWKNMGTNVQLCTLDVSDKSDAIKLLKEASSIGPVGGIFNCAVVLRDGFIENQTPKLFEESCAPKTMASMNLDELSRIMCPQLEYFVCFSSISSGKGIAGLCADGYANSSTERICENRRKNGFHGLAVQLGAISDAGVVHRLIGEQALIAGVSPQKISSCLDSLEYFLHLNQPVLSSYVIAQDEEEESKRSKDILPFLVKTLGLSDISEINTNLSLNEMGVDLLNGSSVQKLLESGYNVNISTTNLLKMNIADIISSVKEENIKRQKEHHREEFVFVQLTLPQDILPKSDVWPLNSEKCGTPLFVIHPFEVELNKLETSARKINAPVFGILSPRGTSTESLEIMAKVYLQEIGKRCANFHLVGLSSGSSLAFEVALESQNNSDNFPGVKKIIFLGGSAPLTSAFLSNQKTMPPKDDDEVLDIYSFLMQFSAHEMPTVKEELMRKQDSDSRIYYAIKLICMSSSERISKSELSEAILSYKRILEISRKYCPTTKLIKDIQMIETPGKLLPNDVATVKSALAKNCSGKIDIYRMPGGKKFLTETDTPTLIANAINKVLDAK